MEQHQNNIYDNLPTFYQHTLSSRTLWPLG